MALYKEITLYNGQLVRYHRLAALEIDAQSLKAVAVLESHTDRSYRVAAPTAPVIKQRFEFNRTADGDVFTEAYQAIKQTPSFSDAEDV